MDETDRVVGNRAEETITSNSQAGGVEPETMTDVPMVMADGGQSRTDENPTTALTTAEKEGSNVEMMVGNVC